MTDTIVQIQHVDFGYRRQPVLRHVDLSIERGTTLGLIGPNGGGKTTLIKLLLGLLEPQRGTIIIDGLPPRQAVRRGDVVGYLPQNPRIPENFPITVRQLARLGLAGKVGLLRATPHDDLRFVDELLDRAGISELANEPVGALSGGQMQRALFVRALAPRPKLLLLDEPTTGVDRAGQHRFIEFIQTLSRELHLTVVLVSHDLRAVTSISDRIACLNVTLHYHDIPQRIPPELAYSMFSCDLAAMGIGGEGHACCEEHAVEAGMLKSEHERVRAIDQMANDPAPMTNK